MSSPPAKSMSEILALNRVVESGEGLPDSDGQKATKMEIWQNMRVNVGSWGMRLGTSQEHGQGVFGCRISVEKGSRDSKKQ